MAQRITTKKQTAGAYGIYLDGVHVADLYKDELSGDWLWNGVGEWAGCGNAESTKREVLEGFRRKYPGRR